MKELGYEEFNVYTNKNRYKIKYEEYLNEESIKRINRYYEKDFEIFKYEMKKQ